MSEPLPKMELDPTPHPSSFPRPAAVPPPAAMDARHATSSGSDTPPAGESRRDDAHLPPRPPPRSIKLFGFELQWRGLKDLLVHSILQLDDTPHRIAFGVFWGFFIGATPTIGLQVMLYWLIASILGANRLSGIPPIWLSNPLTAVPLYYGEWQIGRWLMTGSFGSADTVWLPMADRMAPHEGQSWLSRMFDAELWIALFEGMVELGGELWVGSLVCGILAGTLGYWVTYRAVVAFRARRSIRETTTTEPPCAS